MTKRYSLDIPRRALDLLAEGRAVKSTAPCAAIWGTVRRLTAARRWRDLTVTGSRTVPKAVPRLLRCRQFDSVPQVKEPFEFGRGTRHRRGSRTLPVRQNGYAFPLAVESGFGCTPADDQSRYVPSEELEA